MTAATTETTTQVLLQRLLRRCYYYYRDYCVAATMNSTRVPQTATAADKPQHECTAPVVASFSRMQWAESAAPRRRSESDIRNQHHECAARRVLVVQAAPKVDIVTNGGGDVNCGP